MEPIKDSNKSCMTCATGCVCVYREFSDKNHLNALNWLNCKTFQCSSLLSLNFTSQTHTDLFVCSLYLIEFHTHKSRETETLLKRFYHHLANEFALHQTFKSLNSSKLSLLPYVWILKINSGDSDSRSTEMNVNKNMLAANFGKRVRAFASSFVGCWLQNSLVNISRISNVVYYKLCVCLCKYDALRTDM